MIIIGLDPHPATHTAAALDASTAEVLDALEVENTEEGHERLRRWAHGLSDSHGGERRWAIEGAGNPFVAPLVADLLARKEEVTDIPPSLTSQYRSKRGAKKNDEVDAINAAKALLANPQLPAYVPGPEQRRLQVLTRNRSRLSEALKANRMAAKALPEGSEEERAVLEEVTAFLRERIKRLDALLGELVERIMPEILEVRGVGVVLGATILAEIGDVGRFEKESNFVSYCGGPTERSSGKKSARARVNTGGNRRMNHVLHMMAQVRLRLDPRSKALLERKVREGKTLKGAWRVLKTYVARELYRTLKAIKKSRESGPLAA